MTINYNLWTVAKLIACVVLIPFVVVYMLGKYLWRGLCWVAPFIWAGLCWIGAQIARFWRWLCSLFKREPKAEETPTEDKPDRNWWWLLLILLATVLALFCFNKCSGDDDKGGNSVVIEQQEVVYDKAFDKVVVDKIFYLAQETESFAGSNLFGVCFKRV